MAIIGTAIYVSVLLVNALAVLNEERFLARIGWSSAGQTPQEYGSYSETSVKTRLVELVTAVRTLMRIPLIVINILVILYAIVLG